MTRALYLLLTTLLFIGLAIQAVGQMQPAQPQEGAPMPPQGAPAASPANNSSTPHFAPGSIIRAELAKTIDAKKAKVGDPIMVKTLDELRSQTEVVAPRGAKIVAHVAEVTPHKGDTPSTLGITFDKLDLKNGAEAPLNVTVQAIGMPPSAVQSPAEDNGMPTGPQGTPSGPGIRPGMSPPSPQQAPSNTPTGNPGPPPVLTAKSEGVVGISGVSLSNGNGQAVLTSEKHNVKLESGTQIILRTN